MRNQKSNINCEKKLVKLKEDLDTNSTVKKMSYLDKIKKNKGKVYTKKKKVKQFKEDKKALKPPTINIMGNEQKKSKEELLVVESVNGKKSDPKTTQNNQEPRFSIKISAPKTQEEQLSMSEKSSQSNRISEKSEDVFGKKDHGKTQENMSDNSDSGRAIFKKAPAKKSYFGKEKKESTSQRNNLKLEIKETKNSKSQRGVAVKSKDCSE
jgi:hypothetical protein